MARIDSLAAPLASTFDQDDGETALLGTDALPGGGWVSSWLSDTDGDGNADAIAVQRYTANGNKDGGVVFLNDFPASVVQGESELLALSIDPLANGGYAVSYQIAPPEGFFQGTLTGVASGTNFFQFVGKPTFFNLSGNLAGLTFTLVGTDAGGNPISVAVTPEVFGGGGQIQVDPAIFGQFGNDARLILRVNGLPTGNTLQVFGTAAQINDYNPGSPIQTVGVNASTTLVDPVNGYAAASIGSPLGRIETFDINGITPKSGVAPIYSMAVVTSVEVQATLGLVFSGSQIVRDGATYTLTPQGVISISGAPLTPDANGIVHVPQYLLNTLNSLDVNDAAIILNIQRLEPGSSVQADVSVRIPTLTEDGLFTQIYNAAGVGGIPIGIDSAGAPPATDSDDYPTIVDTDGLAGGGHVTSWVGDADADGVPDTIAVQRFNADGTPNGSAVLLDGIPRGAFLTLDDESGISLSVDPLTGGGYAASYQLRGGEDYFFRPVTGVVAGTNDVFFIGKPESLTISGANVAGLTYALVGVDNGGNPLTVALTPQDLSTNFAEIAVSAAVLAQFGFDARVSLRITGLSSGATVNVQGTTSAINDFEGSSSQVVAINQAAVIYDNVNGYAVATLGSRLGRVEAFDINGLTPKSGTTALYTLNLIGSGELQDTLGLFAVNSPVSRDGFNFVLNGQGIITVSGPGLNPDGNGILAVPAALLNLLDSLDNADAAIFLNVLRLEPGSSVQADLTVRIPTVIEEGIFTQVFDAAGNLGATVRVDTLATSPMTTIDEDRANSIVDTDALANGGWVTSWLADKDGDGDPDAIALQRFAANGTKDGDAVLLDQLPHQVLAGVGEDEIVALAVDPIANGYVVNYQVAAPEAYSSFVVNGTANGSVDIYYAGQPEFYSFSGNVAGLTFSLRGVDANGNSISVAVTPQTIESGYAIFYATDSLLAQFANQTRVTLRVSGLGTGNSLQVGIEGNATQHYDATSPLVTERVTQSASTIYTANLALASIATKGRAEAFDINGLTAKSGMSPIYQLALITNDDLRNALGLTPGASVVRDGLTFSMSGSLVIVTGSPLTPDAGGVIKVPQTLLDILDSSDANDATIILNILQLEPNTPVQVDVTYRVPTVIEQGLFSQTYHYGTGGDDVIVGSEAGAVIDGGDGADYLIGGASDDRIIGGLGGNTLQGRGGNDVYVVSTAGNSIIEFAGEGTDEVRTALSVFVLPEHVENLLYTGGAAPALLIGSSGDNVITGGSGRDELFGRGGNDTIIDGGGGNGNEDTMLGGTGNDVYVVGVRGSSTIESAGEGIDEVRTTHSIYGLQANIENLTFTDDGVHGAGVGNELDNRITGGTAGDALFGRGGNDTLIGGRGVANTLLGQEGDDLYIVDAVGDSVIESVGEGTDTVQTGLSSLVLSANVENLVYTGVGAFTGVGNGEANRLTGGIGNDFLSGLAGADVLVGGSGSDSLIGGDGADQFVFQGGETGGFDRIYDFASGVDKIVLANGGFAHTSTIELVQSTAPVAGNANSTFLYNTENGLLSYDADGAGGGSAVILAQLNPGLSLAVGDFIV